MLGDIAKKIEKNKNVNMSLLNRQFHNLQFKERIFVKKKLECEGYDGLLWGVVLVDRDIVKIILNDFINSFERFVHSFLR
jgi:hypothetical protein